MVPLVWFRDAHYSSRTVKHGKSLYMRYGRVRIVIVTIRPVPFDSRSE